MDSRQYQEQLTRQRRLRKSLPPGFDPFAEPGTYSALHHTPNRVPFLQRLAYAALAVALVAYGSIGVLTDALWLPGRRTSGITFSGIPAWLAFSSLGAGAAGLVSVVIDHYDRRNNEHHYLLFQKVAQRLCIALLVVAGAWHVWSSVSK